VNQSKRREKHIRDGTNAGGQDAAAGGCAPLCAAAAMDIAFNSPPPTRNQGEIIIFIHVAFFL